ncbi:cardiolipin synthase [Caldimonas tepidiphila]|uniref:cardiolipin synthase n=1 Tax=Caldimonas tepidiphila TaxID=2315841 RepID=UPI000E5B93A5|nr:cardiolipin synthase [Caldimonas tepidiphila]
MHDDRRIEHRIERLYGVRDPDFCRSMGVMLGPAIVDGNRVAELHNGDEIFPAMLAAIREAQRSINFETFIYWSGEISHVFAEALSERSRAGVRVHVLLDWFGSLPMDESLVERMKSAGVEVKRFHEPRGWNLSRINNRTHRKVLVVDGRVGFTGGVGIADEWQGRAQDPGHWRDTHYRVEGPVVAQMQAVFLDNWLKATGVVLHGPDYFPQLRAQGDMPAQMFSSSPSGGSESMHLMYLLSITAASRSIDLAAAYFVPDALARRTLIEARKRGVRVRIIVPGRHIDMKVVRRASRTLWRELLEAEVEIHEFQPTMYHVKAMIVDGLLVSVGSTNFDNRSFRLNDEANLNVYDEALAARMTAMFEADLKRSRRITLSQWQRRPWSKKLVERLASLLRPQL